MIEIRTGHNLELLQAMPSKSVQCCLTSPPYWGLRDYGDPGKEWPSVTFSPMPGLPPMTIPASCEPLGLEADPWAYVGHLVALFREVRRVLADDGVLFLNLGDCYAGSSQTGGTDVTGLLGYGNGGTRDPRTTHAPRRPLGGLKPKDLVGIPWRAAFALQADGWYLRSDVIWAKPNPMPESVTDRPTKAHEYVFILSKQGRYFWDLEAIREPPKPWNGGAMSAPKCGPGRVDGTTDQTVKTYDTIKGANARTVWTIPTQPYPGAHFAVWPPELAARCIKAGTSAKGACGDCGKPWVRVVERVKHPTRDMEAQRAYYAERTGRTDGAVAGPGGMVDTVRTTGWRPSCNCNAETVPCKVLDPFGGSGTTGLVAREHGRSAILLEQSSTYADMARRRLGQPPEDLAAATKSLEALPLFRGLK